MLDFAVRRELRLLIAESEGFSQTALRQLLQHFDVESADLDRAGLLNRVGAFDALWVRLRNRIDREAFDAAPRLQFVITNTTGLNHIDLEEAERRGVRVISLRGEAEFLKDVRATAEHTVGLLLALVRHVPAAHAHVCGGGWNRDLFRGNELYGKTAGIVGYGRLGRIVSKYLRAFRHAEACLRTTFEAKRGRGGSGGRGPRYAFVRERRGFAACEHDFGKPRVLREKTVCSDAAGKLVHQHRARRAG